MKEKKGHLTILSIDPKIKNYLVNSISSIIGSQINISGVCLEDENIIYHNTDLILTSGEFMMEIAKSYFPSTPIIGGKRLITGFNLESMIKADRGKKALIVVHPKEASMDTISNLKDIGIEHLHLVPYWKGKTVDISDIDLIITPGMTHICPPGVQRVIDIGPRGVSVATFAKILKYFNLDSGYLDKYEEIYSRQLIVAGQKIRSTLDSFEQLRGLQEAILSIVDEGILMMDEDNNIVRCNQKLLSLFKIQDGIVGSSILLDIINKVNEEENKIDITKRLPTISIKYENKVLYCSKSTFLSGCKMYRLFVFKAVEMSNQIEKNLRLKSHGKGFVAKHTFDSLWGNSEQMKEKKDLAERFAKTNQTILITGESGTGKELFAQAIHNTSERKNKPFVAVNIGAIPENLMESELFGYVEGAFTGAKKSGKIGMFELAHGGTIFLDEIGDAPSYIQVLLLRVLEERCIRRVGAEEYTQVDIRIICATNKTLEDEVIKGNFRKDLFYRLNVLPIPTIPLRDMKLEIPTFINRYLKTNFSSNKVIDHCVLEELSHYKWPGNFRELRNVSEYMYYSSLNKNTIDFQDIPSYIIADKSSNHDLRSLTVNTPLLLPILQILKEVSPISVGRGTIIEELKARDYSPTEGSVKRALLILKNNELIYTGKTRQGSRISELGSRLCNDVTH